MLAKNPVQISRGQPDSADSEHSPHDRSQGEAGHCREPVVETTLNSSSGPFGVLFNLTLRDERKWG